MKEYEIKYVIKSFTSEHTRYIQATDEIQARELFLDLAGDALINNEKFDIVSVTPVESDQTCLNDQCDGCTCSS